MKYALKVILFLTLCLCAAAALGELFGWPDTPVFGQTRPATAPATQPAGHVWCATTQPAADADGSEAKPLLLQRAVDRLRDGDTLALHGGETFAGYSPYPPVQKAGVAHLTVTSYGGRAILAGDHGAAAYFRNCPDLRIAGIDLFEKGRDPKGAGFTYFVGANGLQLFDCDRPVIEDVTVRFFGNGLVFEGDRKVQGGVVRRCNIRENYNAPPIHSQGAYLSCQDGWLFEADDFYMNGWHAAVPQATATMFNHDIYSHDAGQRFSGPYRAYLCTFDRASASGPTADTGAEYDHCVIRNCSNDPQHSPNCWVGGDQGRDSIHDCTLIGVGLRIDSLNADCFHNTFIGVNGPKITIDLPHGAGYAAAQRGPNDTVNVYENTADDDTWPAIGVFKAAKGRQENVRTMTAAQ